MKDIKIKSISEEVRDSYEFITKTKYGDFVKNVEAQKPASMQAIYMLLNENDKVLEFGAGTGTFDYMILKSTNSIIDTYEALDFCVEELNENLKEFEGRYKVFSDKDNFECRFNHYDLVIVDDNWYKAINKLVEKAELKRIYFDGARFRMREAFLKELRKKYTCELTSFSCKTYKYKVGYFIDCTPEKSCLKRYLNYICNYFSIYAVDFKDKGHKRIKARIKKRIKKILLIKLNLWII